MKNIALISLTILSFAVLATSILPVFADSPDPQPGWTYWVAYDQSTGRLVSAEGCSPSPYPCQPVLQQGQALIYITDQPAVVRQFFADARAGKGDSWHVNLQTHQLEKATPTGSITTPLASNIISVINSEILPIVASVGVVLSATLALRRIHR